MKTILIAGAVIIAAVAIIALIMAAGAELIAETINTITKKHEELEGEDEQCDRD